MLRSKTPPPAALLPSHKATALPQGAGETSSAILLRCPPSKMSKSAAAALCHWQQLEGSTSAQRLMKVASHNCLADRAVIEVRGSFTALALCHSRHVSIMLIVCTNDVSQLLHRRNMATFCRLQERQHQTADTRLPQTQHQQPQKEQPPPADRTTQLLQ